jgi:CBS domain-containing protein
MTSLREVMTPFPRCLETNVPVQEAARLMESEEIGDVIVCDDGKVRGILTDRDIAIRAVAHGMDPSTTPVSEICTIDLTMLSPDDSIESAVECMRENALRRVPIVEGDRPVGILSLGDLARFLDPNSALASISSAPPNS